MTEYTVYTYVSEETQFAAKALRQTLPALGHDVFAGSSFQSPTGEKGTQKTLAIITLDGRRASDYEALCQAAIDTLAGYGITAKMVEEKSPRAKIIIDTLQPNLAENITRMQEANKTAILDYAEKAIDALNYLEHSANLIPIGPNGKALDVDFAVKMLKKDYEAVDTNAQKLGVDNALKAAMSPRTGRTRTKTDDAGGDA